MVGRATTCSLDISNYSSSVNWRNTLFNDLWVQGLIPLEDGFPTLSTSFFIPYNNDQLLEKNLDLVDERREATMVQLAYYQQKLKQGFDTSVRARPLAPGDLVLRKVVGTTKNLSWGKLGPNWEEPYRISSMAGIDTYFL